MAESVDAIIGELQLRIDEYRRNAMEVIELNKKLRQSVIDAGGDDKDLGQSGARRAQAEEQTTDRVIKTRKARSTAVKQAANEEVAAEATAAAAKKTILEASARDEARLAEQALTARRRARLQELQDARQAAASAPVPSRPTIIGGNGSGKTQAEYEAQLARTEAARAAVPTGLPISNISLTAPVASDAEAASAKEINHALADRYDLTQKLKVAQGDSAAFLKSELEWNQRVNVYRRAGLSDAEAVTRADAEALAIEKLRAETAEKDALLERARVQRTGSGFSAARFAEGAGLGRTGGNSSAVAGIVVGGGVLAGAEAVKSAADYGRQLQETSKDLGVSTGALQVYQFAAKQAGATNEQLASALGHFQDSLGKAQTGSREQIKDFDALGVSAKGFATAGDALPTIIDRLSQISDPAKRAAVGYQLFGDEYRKLDPILAGGNAKIADLTQRLTDMGVVLSDDKIQKLNDASVALGELGDKLKVDVAGVVADNQKAILGLADALGTLSGKIIQFLNSNPEEALTLVGALAGSRFGVAGAAIGAAGGYVVGENLAHSRDDNNNDLAFRRQQVTAAQQEVTAQQAIAKGGQAAGSTSYLGGLFTIRRGGGEQSGTTLASAQAELKRQQDLFAQAQAKAKPATPPKVIPGSVNQHLLDNLNTPRGPKGKSADTLAAEAEARTKSYNDRLAAFQEADERAQAAMTGDIQKRAGIEKDLTQAALKRQLQDIESTRKVNVDHGADKGVEAARAKALSDAARKAASDQNILTDQRAAEEAARADLGHQQTQLTINGEMLDNSLALAKTAKERHDIESRLLDIAKDQEKAELQAQLKTLKSDDPARADVQKRLDSLDAIYGGRQQDIDQRDATPIQKYADSLPQTAQQVKEAFQQAAVDGIGQFNSALDSSISKMLHLHGLAGQLINDFIEVALKSAEGSLFKGLGSAANNSSGGGIGNILGVVGRALGLGGGKTAGFGGGDGFNGFDDFDGFRASGGPVGAGKTYVVGERGPELLRVGAMGGSIVPNEAINIGSGNGKVAAPNQSMNGQIHVSVETNDDVFTAKVTHISGSQIQAAAPHIAAGGAQLAQQHAQRSAKRRLG